ncbi:MarR family winged helix-turn-helix transcriptional regulator [Modestobacter roseus]|uniref:DNA-binding MarR family transcriptional regulator n=1 Tax=Modestobacter roseus TaxID=1181884 RepID=A0A562IQ51_9ACTN|nr:MarR family transcriptional regulator [Modestobacter roseus]MQA34674.1 MarR family transcriptional regulator [Modestobacter roseus]TWH73147.1 DNA-binding MarR family transcriptional regulator [Modestobacter roseus]
MDDATWLDEREERVWRAFLALGRAVDVAVEQQLTAEGLSTAEYAVLASLSEAPQGAVRARELAREIGWDSSRLAHQLRRMEKRGLLTRGQCPDDARGTMVHLTTEGRAALTRAAPGHVRTVRAHFVDLLTAEEQTSLAAVLERLRAASGDEAPGRLPG